MTLSVPPFLIATVGLVVSVGVVEVMTVETGGLMDGVALVVVTGVVVVPPPHPVKRRMATMISATGMNTFFIVTPFKILINVNVLLKNDINGT